MRTKASKASKGEDEGGFEDFEGEDEGEKEGFKSFESEDESFEG